MKYKLLLKQRIQSSSRGSSFGFCQTFFTTDKIDLDPRSGKYLGSRFALEATGADNLHLEVASLVHEAELDISEDRGTKNLTADKLTWTQAWYELMQLFLVLLLSHPTKTSQIVVNKVFFNSKYFSPFRDGVWYKYLCFPITFTVDISVQAHTGGDNFLTPKIN